MLNLDAVNSVEEVDEQLAILHNLEQYARFKRKAIECRLKGNISAALRYEQNCNTIYKHAIPEDLQW